MNKAILLMSIILVAGLFIAGCSSEPQAPALDSENVIAEDTPEAYVNDQIIDETEEVEIGEMI